MNSKTIGGLYIMGLYDNVRRISKHKGKTIVQLEKETMSPNASISKWDKYKPHIYKVARTAEVLEVPIETLIEGIDIWDDSNR